MLASLKGLCPSGVLSVPLQTLWVRGPKSKVGVRKAQAMTEGTVPCYTSGEAVYKVTEYLVDGDYIFVNDGGSADFKYHEGKAYYTDHVVAITTKESIKAKYLYYYLQNTKEYIDANLFRGSGLKNLSITELGNYLIPLPPLPVQEEIVRILDSFTELTAELTAELTVELTARKKQYEFYRDELLTLGPEVPMEALGDVCLATENIKWDSETDTYWYIDLASVCRDSHSVIEATEVNRDTAPSRAQKLVKEDDVIFATTRPMLQRYSLIHSELDGHICSTGFSVLRADKTKVLPKWIYYNIAKTDFYTYIESVQRGSAYPAVSDRDVKAYKIPIPSLEEQAEIVAILDQLDTLTNSLTEGISAEIEARQKQYEFYREKLLTYELK